MRRNTGTLPARHVRRTACVVDIQSDDGKGFCLRYDYPGMQGAPCAFLNDCPAGRVCQAHVCRAYCRAGGTPCPQGLVCKDIVFPGVKVKFTAEQTGVCVP